MDILAEILVVNMKQLVNRETGFPSQTKILLNSCVHLQSCLTQLFQQFVHSHSSSLLYHLIYVLCVVL